MPLAAPVIIATLSLNSFMVLPPVVQVVTPMEPCVAHIAELCIRLLALQAELGHTTTSGASEAEWGQCMRCGQLPCTFSCGVTLPESPLL
jgi:hypothetical protein